MSQYNKQDALSMVELLNEAFLEVSLTGHVKVESKFQTSTLWLFMSEQYGEFIDNALKAALQYQFYVEMQDIVFKVPLEELPLCLDKIPEYQKKQFMISDTMIVRDRDILNRIVKWRLERAK